MLSLNKPDSISSAYSSYSQYDPCATVISLVSLFHGQARPSSISNDSCISNLPSLTNFYTSRSGLNFFGRSFCKSEDLLMSSDPKSYCSSKLIYNLPTSMLDFFGQDYLRSVKSSLGSMFKHGISHSASKLNLTLSNVSHIWNF